MTQLVAQQTSPRQAAESHSEGSAQLEPPSPRVEAEELVVDEELSDSLEDVPVVVSLDEVSLAEVLAGSLDDVLAGSLELDVVVSLVECSVLDDVIVVLDCWTLDDVTVVLECWLDDVTVVLERWLDDVTVVLECSTVDDPLVLVSVALLPELRKVLAPVVA